MLPAYFLGGTGRFQVKNQLLLAKQHICQAFHKGPHTRYLFFSDQKHCVFGTCLAFQVESIEHQNHQSSNISGI